MGVWVEVQRLLLAIDVVRVKAMRAMGFLSASRALSRSSSGGMALVTVYQTRDDAAGADRPPLKFRVSTRDKGSAQVLGALRRAVETGLHGSSGSERSGDVSMEWLGLFSHDKPELVVWSAPADAQGPGASASAVRAVVSLVLWCDHVSDWALSHTRQPPRGVSWMRWGLPAFVQTSGLVSYAFYMVQMRGPWLAGSAASAEHRQVDVLTLLALSYQILFAWVVFSDPGTLARAGMNQSADGKAAHTCRTCRIVRPLRSKHCAVCGRCVKLLDHHCILINNCVGLRNRHAFIMFLTVALSTHLYYLWVTVSCWSELGETVPALLSPTEWVGAWPHFLWRNAAWVCLVLLHVWCMLFQAGLWVSQLWFVSRNLTANEQINWKRYSHFHAAQQKGSSNKPRFLNRFDRGVLRNWAAFLYDGCEGITLQVEKSLGHARLHTA